jgi:uncharacterized protein YndB with AHSA1/START domain
LIRFALPARRATLASVTTRDIEMTLELDATPEQVWRAISEADEIAKWFAPEVRLAKGPEPRIFVSWGEGMAVEEPITFFEKEKRLRLRFGQNGDTKAPLWVDWTIDGSGGKTILRAVHSGFSTGAQWDEEYDSTKRGWRIFFANLKHYLERHAGQPCVQRPFVLRVEADRDEVWRHIVSARGLDRDGTLAAVAPGAKYALTTAPGRTLAGIVQIMEPARDLALTIADLDDSLLRISLERTKDGTMVYGVVLAYGGATERADALSKDVEAALRGALQRDPPLSVRRQKC